MEIIEKHVMNMVSANSTCWNDNTCPKNSCENCYNDCKDSCPADFCVWH